MKLHKVEAQFKDQVRNLVVVAEDIHDAAYIVGAAYEEDRNFLYVSDIVEAALVRAERNSKMATYQVAAVFSKGIEYYAIEAESEQDARARAEHAFAPNLEFFYIDAVSALDGYIPISDPSPTPSETPRGMRRFCVEAEINGQIHHYYVEAGDWDDAQTKTDRACRIRCGIIEITRLTDLPRKS